MLEKYIDSQEVVTKLLQESLKNNKIVQAYLFVCDDIDYIFDYAKDFTKDIIKLSNLDDNILNNIYYRIDKNEYNELKIVETNGNYIKKEQLVDLQNSVVNKPVEGNKIIYIIKNAEKLNAASANSILKFLEEPEDDIIAILLTDNINNVLPTIKSRCQVLNFKNVKFNVNNNLINILLSMNIDKTEEEMQLLIDSSIEFINTIEKKKLNTFIYSKNLLWDKFKTNDDINILLNFLLYTYMDSMNILLNRNIEYMNDYGNLLDFIVEKNNIDDIINKVNIIEKLKNNLKMNANSKLLFDRMIIELSEV